MREGSRLHGRHFPFALELAFWQAIVSGADKAASAAPAQDVHERVRIEASAVQACGTGDYSEIERRPALRALLDAAMDRLESAIPASFEYAGQRYFVRVRLEVADIGIHTAPGEAQPIVRVLMTGGRWVGHKPGH